MKAYRSREKSASGGYGMTFNPHLALIEGSSISVPCGKCIGCRVSRSRMWAARCMHEASLHPTNCFVTLTYDNFWLPGDYSLKKRHVQLFQKRLRKKYAYKKIRFFTAGEYGDKGQRPHYHLLIFNHRFNDQKIFKQNHGNILYTSNLLSQLWPFGFSTVAPLTYQTAAYTARYVMKKIGGDEAAEHYLRVHPYIGTLNRVAPEFAMQSNKPGIGSGWIDKFHSDVYPSDFLIVDGKKHPVPKYYVLKLEELEQRRIQRGRKAAALKQRQDNTPERLRAREAVLESKLSILKRDL